MDPLVNDDLAGQGSIFGEVPSASGDIGDQGSVPNTTQASENISSSESIPRDPESLRVMGSRGASSSSSGRSSIVLRNLIAIGRAVELVARENHAVAEAIEHAKNSLALEIRALAESVAESDRRMNALVANLETRVDTLLASQAKLRGDALQPVGSRSFSSRTTVSGPLTASDLAGLGVSGLVFRPPPVSLPRERAEREISGPKAAMERGGKEGGTGGKVRRG